MTFLGIDLGTSAVKIILLDREQKCIATSSQSLTVNRPKIGWSEQDPNAWWSATQQAIQQLRQQHPHALAQVCAIGLSGQMHGATLIDDSNQVLRPAILWDDGRSMQQCYALQQQVPNCLQITGNLIFPGFTAPKLLWIKEHEPEIFRKIYKVLLPKDYLRLCITGAYATDLSDASGTCWLDVAKREWSDVMIEATGLKRHHLPEVYEGTDITSRVLPKIAKEWGISADTVVVAGGGDNAASAISMGIINPGQAFLSLGTSGVYFVADDQFHPNPNEALHTMCHCIPQRWHEMSVTLSAASCLAWLAHTLHRDVQDLLQHVQQHRPQHTPLFLPYLGGERTPHNNPTACGVFMGITHETGAAELTQAILEGVAFAFADGQRVIDNARVSIKEVSVIGGGSSNLYWGKILATVLQRTLYYRQQANIGGAFGAARLAFATQHIGTPLQQLFTSPTILHKIEANPDLVQCYQRKYALFRELYPQLRQTMATLTAQRQQL